VAEETNLASSRAMRTSEHLKTTSEAFKTQASEADTEAETPEGRTIAIMQDLTTPSTRLIIDSKTTFKTSKTHCRSSRTTAEGIKAVAEILTTSTRTSATNMTTTPLPSCPSRTLHKEEDPTHQAGKTAPLDSTTETRHIDRTTQEGTTVIRGQVDSWLTSDAGRQGSSQGGGLNMSMVISHQDTLHQTLVVNSNKMQIENIYNESLEIPMNPLAEFAIKNKVEYLGKKDVDLNACLSSLLATIDSAAQTAN
jgi:hypothetical protein